jgi:predicted O-methyltransferase YrrM
MRDAHLGTLIIVDNVVRQGKLIDMASEDPDTGGMRTLIEHMGTDPRVIPAVVGSQ